MAETSTKPYMIRALYEWCCDNGYTPYLAVAVDSNTIVPRQHVKAGEIVLNVSPMATNHLTIGNETVEFQARFSGVAQQISVPVTNISAIYARETGHGMAFDVSQSMGAEQGEDADPDADGDVGPDSRGAGAAGGQAGVIGADDADDLGGEPAPASEAEAGEAAGSSAASSADGGGARKRSGRTEGGADVIAFARTGSSARKKSSASRGRSDETPGATPAEGADAGPADDEPPPADGGGKAGKGSKARLTRVK